jgi:DNA-3-methyladenine glycosylase II
MEARGRSQKQARILLDERDISAGVRALKRVCPAVAAAHVLTGDPPLRRWSSGFDGLARIVVGQQLSTASATAILTRLTLAVDPLDAAGILNASDGTLRSVGLSAAKVATLRAAAKAVETGALDFEVLRSADEATVRSQLTAIRGVGPWTADIYLLFCKGDADAFAPGDLALQVGVQMLMGLPTRPSPENISAIAERWRPWRGVAARLVWAYYGAVN